MARRILAVLGLFPVLLGQQCIEPLPHSTGTPPTTDPPPQVTLHTNRGDIVIELYPLQARAATLFKQYVEEGYYDNTVFHFALSGEFITGGFFRTSLTEKVERPTVADVENGLTNTRGRVSMFTPAGEATAVPQFMIHLTDNSDSKDPDDTTIGRVISGLDFADAISNAETSTGEAADGTELARLPIVPISVNDPTLNVADYTDPASDEEEDENGIPPKKPPVDPGVNRAPVAVARGSAYVPTGITANLRGAGSIDPDGDALTYWWRQTSGEAVTIHDANQVHATYEVGEVEQDLSFELTVRDPDGLESTATVSQASLAAPHVVLDTTLGTITLAFLREPFPTGAPNTVANFLQYVEDGFYDGTIFHRVMPAFVIQGGGFLPGLVEQTGVRAAIENEFDASRSNVRGTVSMAKLDGDPDSATSQFFISLADNSSNLDNQNGGFTVFATVDDAGMAVVDEIAQEATVSTTSSTGVPMDDVPINNIVIERATVQP